MFCLEGKQFANITELKLHHETLLNNILNKYTDISNNTYTIKSFAKYITEKSKRKSNSGSFKPQNNNKK